MGETGAPATTATRTEPHTPADPSCPLALLQAQLRSDAAMHVEEADEPGSDSDDSAKVNSAWRREGPQFHRAVSNHYTWADGSPVEFSFGTSARWGIGAAEALSSPSHGTATGGGARWGESTPPDRRGEATTGAQTSPRHAGHPSESPRADQSSRALLRVGGGGGGDGKAGGEQPAMTPSSPRRVVGSKIPMAAANLPSTSAAAVAATRRLVLLLLLLLLLHVALCIRPCPHTRPHSSPPLAPPQFPSPAQAQPRSPHTYTPLTPPHYRPPPLPPPPTPTLQHEAAA